MDRESQPAMSCGSIGRGREAERRQSRLQQAYLQLIVQRAVLIHQERIRRRSPARVDPVHRRQFHWQSFHWRGCAPQRLPRRRRAHALSTLAGGGHVQRVNDICSLTQRGEDGNGGWKREQLQGAERERGTASTLQRLQDTYLDDVARARLPGDHARRLQKLSLLLGGGDDAARLSRLHIVQLA